MNASLYQAASALDANTRWQELIAENLASSSIPGFKKQELSFAAVQALNSPHPTSTPGSLILPRANVATCFLPGEMRQTGIRTDVAIDGNGFFEVQLPDGSSAFTRDGEFQINSNGQLVTKSGFLLLGDTGPIQLDFSNTALLSISSTGEVSQGPDSKGRIRITNFDNPASLTPISRGLFLSQDPNTLQSPATNTALRQGWLESANTSVVAEMANLLTAMRTFEANQRIIHLHDERLAKSISELTPP